MVFVLPRRIVNPLPRPHPFLPAPPRRCQQWHTVVYILACDVLFWTNYIVLMVVGRRAGIDGKLSHRKTGETINRCR